MGLKRFIVNQHTNLPLDLSLRHLPKSVSLVDYRAVAEVQASSLDEAFALTNHGEHAWWENPQIKMVDSTYQARSTSVGDLVFDCTEICYWMVAPTGYLSVGEWGEADVELEDLAQLRESKAHY